MNDVAIIGVGLHPFGRFEGKSAMEMGVDAISPPSPMPECSGATFSSPRAAARPSPTPTRSWAWSG
jgi:hypothetical protein